MVSSEKWHLQNNITFTAIKLYCKFTPCLPDVQFNLQVNSQGPSFHPIPSFVKRSSNFVRMSVMKYCFLRRTNAAFSTHRLLKSNGRKLYFSLCLSFFCLPNFYLKELNYPPTWVPPTHVRKARFFSLSKSKWQQN